MTSSIVHFGKGNYGAVPEGKREFVDPTVAKPRASIPAARLQTLRRLKAVYHAPKPEGPTRFVPGPLLDMRRGQCRYPIDDKRFCGAESFNKRSWCPHHDDIVHGRKVLEAAE